MTKKALAAIVPEDFEVPNPTMPTSPVRIPISNPTVIKERQKKQNDNVFYFITNYLKFHNME
jgi:hypothetical protein